MRNIFLFGLVMAFVFSFAKEGQRHLSVKIESQQEQKLIELEKQIKSQEEQINSYRNNIEIIEKVEEFYDRSWNKLIGLIGILGAIIGIGVPYFQKKEFGKELQRHKEDFEKYVEETNRKKEEEIKSFFNDESEKWKTSVKKYIDEKNEENEKKIREFFSYQYGLLKQEYNSEISEVNKHISEEVNEIYSNHYNTIGLLLLDNDIDVKHKQGVLSLVLALGYILKNEKNDIKYLKSIIDIINTTVKRQNNNFGFEEDEKNEILKVIKSLKSRFPEEFDVDSIIDFIKKDVQ